MKVSISNRTVQLLSRRNYKEKKSKFRMIILAVALTTMLFTCIMLIGSSMLMAVQNSRLRAEGSTAQVCLKGLSKSQYETIIQDSAIKDYSYNIPIAIAENEELQQTATEIRYSEDKAARWWFSYPEEGRMPQKNTEIATSRIVLQRLGIPAEIGQTVEVLFSVDGVQQKETFTLCGYWEGNPMAGAQQMWVSRTYFDHILQVSDTAVGDRENMDYVGTIFLDLNFRNSIGLENQCENLLKRCNLENQVRASLNAAYLNADVEVDLPTILTVVLMVAIIIFAGGFIIYNIFSITVNQDIQYYGLLKTLGTEETQLHQLVARQMIRISVIGIPLGLAAGVGSEYVLLPYIASFFSNIGTISYHVHPLALILSAAVAQITILISCRKPFRMIHQISPIDASKYVEVHKTNQGNGRTNVRITPKGIAYRYLTRTKQKVITVVCSLSLSVTLLNGLFILVRSMDVEEYVHYEISCDFLLSDESVFRTGGEKNLTAMDEALQKQISELPGIENVSNLYAMDDYLILNESSKEAGLEYAQYEMERYGYTGLDDMIKRMKEESIVNVLVYGVDEWLFHQLDLSDPTIDWETFQTGDYLLINCAGVDEQGNSISYYQPGQKAVMKLSNGIEKTYTVLGTAEVPGNYSVGYSYIINPVILLPQQEFKEVTKEKNAFMTAFNVAEDKNDEVQEWLENLCSKEDTGKAFKSKAIYVQEFQRMRRLFILIGTTLGVILGTIGLMNFLNSMKASIYARKTELAILEAIGMEESQMEQMVMIEGLIYSIGTLICSVTIGFGIDAVLVSQISYYTGSRSYSMTIWPAVVLCVLLMVISCFIPFTLLRKEKKASLVMRMHQGE